MNSLFDINNYFFNAYALVYFFSGIFASAEGLFVYLQNRKSMVNIGFAAVTVCAGIWLTGVGFIFSSHSEPIALAWSRHYSWFGIIFITPCLYLFSLAWANKSIKQKIVFLQLNFLTALAFYIVCFSTPYIVKAMWPFPWGYYPKAGIGHGFFLIWFSIQVFLIFRNFLHSFKNEKLERRKLQTKYIIIAFIFGVFMGSLDFLANYGFQLHSIGGVAIVIFSSIIAYSIVNYKLMDIETVLHKTLLWTLSFSIITVPIFVVYRLSFPYMKYSAGLQLTFGIVSFIVFAVYLRHIQPGIDHVFQRRRANLEEISSQFVESLVYLKGLNNLIRTIEETIASTMYPQWIDIFIYDDEKKSYILTNKSQSENRPAEIGQEDLFLKWLTQNNGLVYRRHIDSDPDYAAIKEVAEDYFIKTEARLAIPLILNEQLLGIINLGKKSNLRRYRALDFHFLTILKNQSAIAISNSLIYQDIEKQVSQRTAELVAVQKQLIQAEKLATAGHLSPLF